MANDKIVKRALRPLPKPRGRGMVEIEPVVFGIPSRHASMAEILDWIDHGATLKEIAGTLRCSHDTIERRLKQDTGLNYTQLREQACGRAMINLRKSQFKLAKTSAPMAIWLGQQYLGQSTTSSLQVSVEPEARTLLKAWEDSLIEVTDEGREDIAKEKGRSGNREKG